MTRAFVTGIAGQDGSILAEKLVAEGTEVHGLVRSQAEFDGGRAALPSAVQLHIGDLAQPDRIAGLMREVEPDEVYNLGGISSVAFSWEHPVPTGKISGVGAVAVFEAAHRVQEASGRTVRVVQASSAEMFGEPDRVPQDEGTTIRPVSPYGAAKAYAHMMAAVYRRRGLHVASCILYNHESPRRPTTFVTRKITEAAARIADEGAGTLAMGNLDARRDWGWAPDYVDALIRAARHRTGEDFVIATGSTHTVADFVAAAFARVGIEGWRDHVVVDPRFVRPADPAMLVGDATRARTELGWAPTVPFEEIVGRMVDHDVTLRGEQQ